jgi:2-oxoglutarate dehydrogenase E1 component
VFTPKSLLRDSRCVSTIEEFENGSFQETIDDDAVNKADVTLVFCTGKFYYELTAEREK